MVLGDGPWMSPRRDVFSMLRANRILMWNGICDDTPGPELSARSIEVCSYGTN